MPDGLVLEACREMDRAIWLGCAALERELPLGVGALRLLLAATRDPHDRLREGPAGGIDDVAIDGLHDARASQSQVEHAFHLFAAELDGRGLERLAPKPIP